MVAAGSRVGVPPPRYTVSRRGRPPPAAGDPNFASSASARSAISVTSASTNAATRARGPRDSEPAYTTKSQYGHSDTQNGTWMYSATGGCSTGAPAAAGPGDMVTGSGKLSAVS